MDTTRQSLLEAIQNRMDPARWGDFAGTYTPLLVSYLAKWGIRGASADDVVQEVFVKLMTVIPAERFDRSRRFRTWLYTVTRNAAHDWWRKQQRQQRAEQAARECWPGMSADETDETWDDDARQHVLQRALEQVRAQSEPDTWACFEQHVLCRIAAKDVAAKLHKNASAVYANSSRVLARVRQACRDYFEDLDDEPAPEQEAVWSE